MRINFHHTKPGDHHRARKLRQTASPTEQKLWFALRQSAAAHNLKFRRQQPIPPFVVDFACMNAKLVIELDGFSHDARSDDDAKRDDYLNSLNYQVLRFANDDVIKNLEAVVMTIISSAKSRIPAYPLICEN